MPTYEAVCSKCGVYSTYFRKVSDCLNTPICCGVNSDKVIFSVPMMIADVAPWDSFESPATGKVITSRAERREDMKRSGCRDWEGMANEKDNAARQKKYMDAESDKVLDSNVRKAWASLSPEKKALALAA